MPNDPPRYAVWHTTGESDGESVEYVDSCWSTLSEAESEFAMRANSPDIVEVELLDFETEPPVIIKRFDARN